MNKRCNVLLVQLFSIGCNHLVKCDSGRSVIHPTTAGDKLRESLKCEEMLVMNFPVDPTVF